ncbi:hypothetical protein [Sphingomonas endolithica]|uniref:hypothetical protein n=1 Tax=Sphingomonas endolithica TaxID=2972485 RepID=UPI0021AFA875|nr:hypothetical protein [Sphingomonas sp. ZFBP2030]
MRSQTLLTAATPRHPFRARIAPAPKVKTAHPDDSDLKLFALSFTAFFVCIYTLIF